MCLSKIEKFKPNKVGYKIVFDNEDYYKTYVTYDTISKKKWNQSIPQPIILHTPRGVQTYKTGYHLYNSFYDALNSSWLSSSDIETRYNNVKIIQVKYKGDITIGYGDGTPYGGNIKQIVAPLIKVIKEMKIPKKYYNRKSKLFIKF